MALVRSGKQWIIAILLILLVVVFAEWLEYRFHTLSDFSHKDNKQYEVEK
ncbi:hypothetical protein HDF26_001024 [Pedobacter cryoconitis]|uniref:Uncharacterized protein n=1 Tax=Pedobacter cryoconitis TaxID=188932 RepID=A0A7W8ZR07_9SPHI|nr:hypothetical protein [Pedobacter cryoconitis]MBB5638415.1 hypothetical protein [Pedobacter cryoconitis]MBB6270597.1 hypothetical protein [Pedobacter cryoconitis]